MQEHHSTVVIDISSIMELFSKLMSALGVWNGGVDIVGILPVEIAEIILQKLDARSLFNAARVSKKWMAICRGCACMRKSARRYLRKQKRRIIQDGLQDKRNKSTPSSSISKMQFDTVQTVSLHRNTQNPSNFIYAVTPNQYGFYKNYSRLTKSPIRGTNISTRSRLRLR